MVGVLQAIEALVRYANQLVSLLTVLREHGDAVVHVDANAQLQGLKRFGEDRLNAASRKYAGPS
jgi:hypothetical protein